MNFTKLDNKALLRQAAIKVRRLREVRETIAVGIEAAEEVERCLAVANDAMEKLMVPEACYEHASCQLLPNGLLLDNRIKVIEPKLVKCYSDDALVFVYNLSLGYDASQMMKELAGDYALYHFHYYIGRTLLLLIGREFFRCAVEKYPEYDLRRFPIPISEDGILLNNEDQIIRKYYWDPQKIAQLLPILSESNTDLAVTDGGCISPLFTVVGVMIASPTQQKLTITQRESMA